MYKLPVWLRSPSTGGTITICHKTGHSKGYINGTTVHFIHPCGQASGLVGPHGSWLAPSPVGTIYFHWLNIVGNICFP